MIHKYLFFVCIAFFSFSAIAQEKQKGKHRETHYHLSAFGGFTFDEHDKQGYKIGLEYEWRTREWFGIGGSFDFTGAEFKNYAICAGPTFYPFYKTPFVVAAAIGAKNAHGEWMPFLRGGVIYDFHVEHFSIGPMVLYDVLNNNHNIISIGLSVGFGFKE